MQTIAIIIKIATTIRMALRAITVMTIKQLQ